MISPRLPRISPETSGMPFLSWLVNAAASYGTGFFDQQAKGPLRRLSLLFQFIFGNMIETAGF
jgi:hypothetical protein